MTKPIRLVAVGMFAVAGALLAFAYATHVPRPTQVYAAPRPFPATLQAAPTIPPAPVARFAERPTDTYVPLESLPEAVHDESLGDPLPLVQPAMQDDQPNEFPLIPPPVDKENLHTGDYEPVQHETISQETSSSSCVAVAQPQAAANVQDAPDVAANPRARQSSADDWSPADEWRPTPPVTGRTDLAVRQELTPPTAQHVAPPEPQRTPLDCSPFVVKLPGSETPIATVKLVSSTSTMIPFHKASHQRPARYSAVIGKNSVARSSLYIDIDAQTGNSTFEANNIELTELLRLVADRTGANVEHGREVRGLISAKITDKPLIEALTEIVAPLGYVVHQRPHLIIVDLPGASQLGPRRRARIRRSPPVEAATEKTNPAIPISNAVSDPRVTVADSALPTADTAVNVEPAKVERIGLEPSTAEQATSEQENSESNQSAKALVSEPPRLAPTADSESTSIMLTGDQAKQLMRNGEYSRAVNLLSEAATNCHDAPRLFSLLGEAYYRVKSYEPARVAISRSLELNKDDARANYIMGCVLAQLGQTARGQHYFLQAHDLDPMYPTRTNETFIAPR